MSLIQTEFDRESGDFILAPGEHEGPLTIRRPCVVDGKDATLWAPSGPVLTIASPGVTVRNLRVEIAGSPAPGRNRVAVQNSAAGTVLDNVEVRGDVVGIPGEPEHWDAPGLLALGDFAANRPNSFAYALSVPAEAALECRIKDVTISPVKLSPGKTFLSIRTGPMRDNTILYGELLLKTGVSRRIYVLGRSRADAPEHNEEPPISGVLPLSEPVQTETPDAVIAPAQPDAAPAPLLSRGQRIPADVFGTGSVKLVLTWESAASGLDVDPYVFRVRSGGKVASDDDLLFFGNPGTESGDVRIVTEGGQCMAVLELSRAESGVERYVVCFSIYEDCPCSFSALRRPSVRLIAGGLDRYCFPLEDLSREKTVVALEFYRYKGSWKLNAVGRGYDSGLKQLCMSYGVDVE